ncbi:MAG: phosphomannomutase/phosphoglucomutase [Gammaproteobacteria bacterium]
MSLQPASVVPVDLDIPAARERHNNNHQEVILIMRIGDRILRQPRGRSVLYGVFALLLMLASGPSGAEDSAKSDADNVVRAVGEFVSSHAAKLKELCADPAVAKLLRGNDAAALAEKEQAIAAAVPDAVGLRLIPKGQAEVDSQSAMPIGYGSLSMITQAETGTAPVNAEVQVFGTPGQHLALVQRVSDADGVAGVAYVGINIDALATVLANAEPASLIQLRQDTGAAKPWTIAASSQDAPPAGKAVQIVAIDGTNMRIAFWSGKQAPAAAAATAATTETEHTESGASWGAMLGGVLAVLSLIGAGLWWRQRSGDGAAAVEAVDTTVFRGAIAAIIQGAYPGVEQFIPRLPQKPSAPTTTAREKEMLANIASRAAAAAGVAPPDSGVTVNEEPPTRVMKAAPSAVTAPAAKGPPESIFRAYDIRGVVGETLTVEGVYLIGKALGSEAGALGQSVIVVGRDGRNSSPELAESLAKGIRDSGRDVVDIGMVPTPVLYFATHFLDTGNGVMVTGSHNPPNYNGLKIVLDGQALAGDAVKNLYRRIVTNDFTSGEGSLETTDIVPEYIQRITEDIPLALDKSFRVVVDCGNGVPGAVAPRLITALGHDVIELYCDVDGNFPNHHPDPSQPENLEELIATVKANQADIGLAFDGDGDRLGVVDSDGNIIWPDRQMMLYARDVLSRNPGAEILFDVKCSRQLGRVIKQAGGKPVMWKTGHSLIKAKMRESGAPLAGEMSGHIFFKERWYGFDDALYTAARLLEILVTQGRNPKEVFASLPGGVATPELRIDMPESKHAEFMKKLIAGARFEGAQVTTIDGMRVDFPKAWGLIRPSNTTPVLVLRFEGDDKTALAEIQSRFRTLIQQTDPTLKIPF